MSLKLLTSLGNKVFWKRPAGVSLSFATQEAEEGTPQAKKLGVR